MLKFANILPFYPNFLVQNEDWKEKNCLCLLDQLFMMGGTVIYLFTHLCITALDEK